MMVLMNVLIDPNDLEDRILLRHWARIYLWPSVVLVLGVAVVFNVFYLWRL
jgi:hypothetical protein